MKTQSPDTSVEAERVQIEIVRRMPVWRRLQLADGWNQALRELAKVGLRERHPGATEAEIQRRFLQLRLGTKLAESFFQARASRHHAE